jgi:hypothetical protein
MTVTSLTVAERDESSLNLVLELLSINPKYGMMFQHGSENLYVLVIDDLQDDDLSFITCAIQIIDVSNSNRILNALNQHCFP